MNRRDFVSGIAVLGFAPIGGDAATFSISDSATGNVAGSFSEPLIGEIRSIFEVVPEQPGYYNGQMKAVVKFYVFDGPNGWRPLGDSAECVQNVVNVWNKALRAAADCVNQSASLGDADGQG
jgi:hypothetical protein